MKRTQKQIEAWRKTMNMRPIIPWNKGKTYIHKSKGIYANKGAWNQAIRRVYKNECMRCGWKDGSCDTHHIIPQSKGGQFTIENGIILCPNCHRLADLGKITIAELKRIKNANSR